MNVLHTARCSAGTGTFCENICGRFLHLSIRYGITTLVKGLTGEVLFFQKMDGQDGGVESFLKKEKKRLAF